ncbi:RNA ligase [Methanobacterium sp. SMA-27]|uniref:RNA ligase n=1 Tax=Methanobacterium sp. SMA-27 TaxID=1495336 RepID=UPI0009DE7DE2|nr:RNA ligase [Methanobacterium sp. SMA-27]
MQIRVGKTNSHKNFFLKCNHCNYSYETPMPIFISNVLPEILDVEKANIERSFKNGNIKFYESQGINGLLFRKSVGKIESGTMVCFGDKVEIIRGFPKIRRTLMLEPSLRIHFDQKVAVEEKMNGYNVRIALINNRIIAFTRGGYVCPYTTKKAPEIMDMDEFFNDHPELVICGEMVGTENPYVTHHYREIGNLGFRIFDIREKSSNNAMSIPDKIKILEFYGLPGVKLFEIMDIEDAPKKIFDLVFKLGKDNREGVVIKDPSMEIDPLKYTSSQAHNGELQYAFTYPFDFGRSFFFSRVIREGFQAYELNESEDEIRHRAHMIGESILYPMIHTIKHVANDNLASENIIIHVDNMNEAEDFVRYLRDLGVVATVHSFEDGKAIIRRVHQSTTDRISNFLRGGLY